MRESTENTINTGTPEAPKPSGDEPATLAELAARIRGEHAGAKAAVRRGLEHALKAGELLIEAKGRLNHGEWGAWLRHNCSGLSDRTARLYMQLAGRKSTLLDEN